MKRRGLLLGAGAVGLTYLAFREARHLFPPSLEFEPIKSLPGFRRVAGGDVSRGSGAFAGLAPDADPEMRAIEAAVREDVCAALFGERPAARDVVRIAYFSDFNCPYCRVLSTELAEREKDAKGAIRVVWHELPLLGKDSELAARAAVAARRQGAYDEFHQRLMRSGFRVTRGYLRALAATVGIDADRLLADLESDAVQEEIRASRALAGLFGFYGTPGTVVERTAALGYLQPSLLDELIAVEREATGPCGVARRRG